MGLCRPYWTLEAIFVCVVEFTRIQQDKKKTEKRGKTLSHRHIKELSQLPLE